MTGFASCKKHDSGDWVSRSAYTNQDQYIFRTIGETLEGNDANIKEEQIRCLGADFMTIKTGSDNCWPFWLEGGNIEVGVELDGTPIKQD